MIGKTLGKYRITEHLGSGGMADVYKAYQPGLDRYVAIKVLHSFLASEGSFLTRFQREAKAIAMLRHPNIIRVYDFDLDEEGNAYYIVMEFVDGPNLKTHLQEVAQEDQTLPLEEVVPIVIAVANALDYAHQHGTVHRDVKPANIMFNHEGEVILTDFGIAKMVNVIGLTASGAMIGTPAYMAPEQGMGQAGDERSDIYSLGIVLHQLVTGHLPFEADTPMGIVFKHINEPLTPPTASNRNLPPDVEAVIMRVLAKAPEERYQTAKEFAADLKRILASQAIEPVALESTAVSATSAVATGARVQDQAKQWEMATLPSAPAYRPPSNTATPGAIPAVRPQRRRIRWLIALLALIAIGGSAALFATGRAKPLERLLAVIIPQTATPTPGVTGTPTATPDTVATDIAAAGAALATRDALATYEATVNFTPSPTPTPTPTSTPTPDLTATFIAACVFDLEVVGDRAIWPSVLMPGQQFVKRWDVKNTGTCAWPEGVQLVFASGDELEVVEEPEIESLAPEETLRIEITLRAPTSYNSYASVWQLQDSEGNPIGEELELACRVDLTPTPRPTAMPTATPTPEFTPTPTTPLWMSAPVLAWCDGAKAKGRVEWGHSAGPSNEYRFFYSSVSPESELPGPYREAGFPHVEKYFTASGTLVFPLPGNCGYGDYGRCGSLEEGYEIVWYTTFYTAKNCPSE